MKYYEYTVCILLAILILCVLYLTHRINKKEKIQDEIVLSLFAFESSLHDLQTHIKNIDDDMYSISQKHGIRVSNNRF